MLFNYRYSGNSQVYSNATLQAFHLHRIPAVTRLSLWGSCIKK